MYVGSSHELRLRATQFRDAGSPSAEAQYLLTNLRTLSKAWVVCMCSGSMRPSPLVLRMLPTTKVAVWPVRRSEHTLVMIRVYFTRKASYLCIGVLHVYRVLKVIPHEASVHLTHCAARHALHQGRALCPCTPALGCARGHHRKVAVAAPVLLQVEVRRAREHLGGWGQGGTSAT